MKIISVDFQNEFSAKGGSLIGLMLEICVLCTLQELRFRGYQARVLFEGVDTYMGDETQKRLLFETLFPFWGQPIYWREM